MYLVTAREMREIDRKAVDLGIPALVLMENAGKAVASEAASQLRDPSSAPLGRAALVLAGPGQNGGDGFCAARHLSSMGFPVTVCFFGDEARLPPEARANYEALKAYAIDVQKCGSDASFTDGSFGVVVDALLGTGQRGDPHIPIDAGVRLANALRAEGIPVVACDIPTGVDADTGRMFEPAVHADVTVTMGFAKVGLYSYPGRGSCGRIVVDTLGLPPGLLHTPSRARAILVEDARAVMPFRAADHHKGLSGHVTVMAGSVGMAGAAVLSARAALRAGAGTVTLLCPGDIYAVCASMVPEIMVLPCVDGPCFRSDPKALETATAFVRRSSCVVLGPGFGRDAGQEEFLSELIRIAAGAHVPCLVDADGLYALSRLGGPSYLAGHEGKFVLTPHPGELANLVGAGVRDIVQDRPGYAAHAALQSRSVVCLKGAGTCVANSSGDLTVNTSGDPAMATAGSGDVLSGVIAALVSQGLSPFDASWLGVFWHGLAGERARQRLGSYGVLAGDLCDSLPEARQVIESK